MYKEKISKEDNRREHYRDKEIEGAAGDDLDLTLRNACGIQSTQAAYLKALACSLPPTIPLTHPSTLQSSSQLHLISLGAGFSMI